LRLRLVFISTSRPRRYRYLASKSAVMRQYVEGGVSRVESQPRELSVVSCSLSGNRSTPPLGIGPQ
jgi:hypothetical protein